MEKRVLNVGSCVDQSLGSRVVIYYQDSLWMIVVFGFYLQWLITVHSLRLIAFGN